MFRSKSTSFVRTLDERAQIVEVPFSTIPESTSHDTLPKTRRLWEVSTDTFTDSGLSTSIFSSPSFSSSEFSRADTPSQEKERCDFHVMMNIKHFKPGEVVVILDGNHVVIHGLHPDKADSHGFVSREFKRRYPIPTGLDPSTLVARRDLNHILTVRSPLKEITTAPPQLETPKPIVPIKPKMVPDVDERDRMNIKKDLLRKKEDLKVLEEKERIQLQQHKEQLRLIEEELMIPSEKPKVAELQERKYESREPRMEKTMATVEELKEIHSEKKRQVQEAIQRYQEKCITEEHSPLPQSLKLPGTPGEALAPEFSEPTIPKETEPLQSIEPSIPKESEALQSIEPSIPKESEALQSSQPSIPGDSEASPSGKLRTIGDTTPPQLSKAQAASQVKQSPKTAPATKSLKTPITPGRLLKVTPTTSKVPQSTKAAGITTTPTPPPARQSRPVPSTGTSGRQSSQTAPTEVPKTPSAKQSETKEKKKGR